MMARNQQSPKIRLIGGAQPDDSQGIASVQFKDGNTIVKTLPACAVCIAPDDESLKNVLYLENINNIRYYVIGPWFEDIRPDLKSFTRVTISLYRFNKQSNPKTFEFARSDIINELNEIFINSNFFILPLRCDDKKKELTSDFLKRWSSRIVLCRTPKDICEFYHEFAFFGFKQEQLGLKRQESIRRSFRRKRSSSRLENSLFKYYGFRIHWDSNSTHWYMKGSDYKMLMDFGIISIPDRNKRNCFKVVGCYIKNQENEIKIYSLLSEAPFSVHAVEESQLNEILANTSSQPDSNGSIQPLAVISSAHHPDSNTEPSSLHGNNDHQSLPSQGTGNLLANGNHGRPKPLQISPARDVGRPPLSPPPPPPISPPPEQAPQTAALASGQSVSAQDSTLEQVVTDSGQPGRQTGEQAGSLPRVAVDSGMPVNSPGQHGSTQGRGAGSRQIVSSPGQRGGSPQGPGTISSQPVSTGHHGSPQGPGTVSSQPVSTRQHGSTQGPGTGSRQPVSSPGQRGGSPQRPGTITNQPVSTGHHGSPQGPGTGSRQPVSSPGQRSGSLQGENSSSGCSTSSSQSRQQSSTLQRPCQRRNSSNIPLQEGAASGTWPRRNYPQHAARRSFIEENFNELLLDLSPRISVDWKTLGGKLGLEPYELSNIDDDFRRTQDKAYEMLKKWRQKYGREATPQVLVAALRGAERNDLSDIVQEFAITGRYNMG